MESMPQGVLVERLTEKPVATDRISAPDEFSQAFLGFCDAMCVEYNDLWSKEVIGDTKMAWYSRLVDEGITAAALRMGYKKCLKDKRFMKFPPNIREFIELCTIGPEDMGLPSLEDAYRDACGVSNKPRHLIHEAVRAAVLRFGEYDLRNRTDGQVKKEFMFIYSMIVKSLLETGQLPVEVPKALPRPEDVIVTTREGIRNGMRMLKDSVK